LLPSKRKRFVPVRRTMTVQNITPFLLLGTRSSAGKATATTSDQDLPSSFSNFQAPT
jgi:hypothetical protein